MRLPSATPCRVPQRQRLDHFVDRVRQREGHRLQLDAPRLDLGEVEDVVDDRQERPGLAADHLEALGLRRRQRAVERQLGHADDAVHRRADLVAHVGEEFALGAGRRLGRLFARAVASSACLRAVESRKIERKHRPPGGVALERDRLLDELARRRHLVLVGAHRLAGLIDGAEDLERPRVTVRDAAGP
jgi:hypothetical protein